MIWFWRVLGVFGVLNLINIIAVDGGAGMEPVWVAIIIGSVVLSIPKCYHYFFSKKWFKILLIIGVVIFSVVEGCIIFSGMSLAPTPDADYVIVLGARVRGETPSLALKYRLDKAYDYLEKYPDAKAVLTGGQGAGESITEAEAMKRYLVERGVKEEHLLMEDKATDTDENLAYSFTMIDAEMADAEVLVVTSSFHVLRSRMIARDLGRVVGGMGARTLPFLIPNYYLREFFAVLEEMIF
ncbi:MAG: YdcF family protein [Cellulosilyticaceae bacterium]